MHLCLYPSKNREGIKVDGGCLYTREIGLNSESRYLIPIIISWLHMIQSKWVRQIPRTRRGGDWMRKLVQSSTPSLQCGQLHASLHTAPVLEDTCLSLVIITRDK